MNEIYRLVRRVWRRMMLERFLRVLGWALVAGLVVGGLGALASKIWVLPIPVEQWVSAWFAAGVTGGLLVAVAITWWRRLSMLDAALEIDRRFALSERLSSCLAMTEPERQTLAGQALLEDARLRIQQLDVAGQFRVRAHWSLAIPVPLAAMLVLGLWWIPNAEARIRDRSPASQDRRQLLQQQAAKLERQLRRQQEKLSQEALEQAQQLFSDLQRSLEDLQKQPVSDRKQVLAQLNELKDKIEEKRRELGGMEQLRRQLENLKGLNSGPGQELANALRQGDYSKAREALQQLKEKLASNSLSEAEKKELAGQLEAIQRKLTEFQQQYEEARRELERQLAAAQRAGNLEAANQIQQKLNQLQSMQSQMNQLGQLADALSQASQSLRQGDSRQAVAQLQQAAGQLARMQTDMETLQACEAMLDELEAMSEDWLSDSQMAASQNMGFGGMDGQDDQVGGFGLGRGRGRGDRPEQATDTQSYESRVAGKLQRGKAVITGSTGGPNLPGESFESVKEAVQADFTQQTEPVEDIQLPRDQQEHTKEYFQKFVKP
ncbi:MAG: hypothetical protein KatS3mg110_4034 [Pirellulaceae bacterium]|nr:MAG: hypothetical protein KatS3mg110_4034 [Pirellulaceae bacterium]